MNFGSSSFLLASSVLAALQLAAGAEIAVVFHHLLLGVGLVQLVLRGEEVKERR